MKTFINLKTFILLCTTFFSSSCSRSPFTSAFYVRNAVNMNASDFVSSSTDSCRLHIISFPWSPRSLLMVCDSDLYYVIPPKDVYLPTDTINQ